MSSFKEKLLLKQVDRFVKQCDKKSLYCFIILCLLRFNRTEFLHMDDLISIYDFYTDEFDIIN